MMIKYDKNQYNYMFRMTQYFLEMTDNNEIKKMISDFTNRIEYSCGWIMEDGSTKIVLNLSEADIAVLLYVYENIIFFTAEGQRIMNVCPDRFSVLYKKMMEECENDNADRK